MNQGSAVIVRSILIVAAVIISINAKGYSMCDDEVFVSDEVYITGCIINPGVVSPGEYIFAVRMTPLNGRTRDTGAYYTYLGRTGRKTVGILYKWYTPFKSAPEIEEKLSLRIEKDKDQSTIKLRSASDCTAASVKVISFKGNQLEHQIILSERCRNKIKK